MMAAVADYIRETDKIMHILCLTAGLFGAVVVYSASLYSGTSHQFAVQLAAVAIGFAAAIFISNFDYADIAKIWWLLFGGLLLLVVATKYIGYTPTGTNNTAWIMLPGGIAIQPSEYLKVAFIISFAAHVYWAKERVKSPVHTLLLLVHGVIPIVIIHFLQHDDGTAIVFAVIFLAMMLAAGVKLRYFAILLGAAAAGAPMLWFWFLADYQRQRILALFNHNDPILNQGINYQPYRGSIAIGSGGFSGYGLFHGPSVQSGQLPLASSDFVFASIGEELGFIGCIVVIVLVCAICLRAVRVAALSRDKMGAIMCVGVFAWLATEALINIGMALCLLPVVGVTLPFFTAGGTSVVAVFLGIGVVISVYMHRGQRMMFLNE